MKTSGIICFICLFAMTRVSSKSDHNEEAAKQFLMRLGEESSIVKIALANAELNFEQNKTDNARNQLFEAVTAELNNVRKVFQEVNQYSWKTFRNPDTRRQMKLLSTAGLLALTPNEYYKLEKIKFEWKNAEKRTNICDYFNTSRCELGLNMDVKDILRKSRDPVESSHLLTSWKRATGPMLKNFFKEYLGLCKRAAKLNNLTSIEEHYLRNLELPNYNIANVKAEMAFIWEKVKPFYQEIHAYIRRRLRNIYGENFFSLRGMIPSFLLREINLADWLGTEDLMPYSLSPDFSLTSLMLRKNYTLSTIHRLAEDYFTSMSFGKLTNPWIDSQTNMTDCESQVFDLGKKGVRIKHCATGLPEDFFKALQLMTKAEYFILTRDLPYPYRGHADQSVEMSLRGAVVLSASSPEYLKSLGLYDGEETKEMRINRLFKLALDNIIPISLNFVYENWRMNAFGDDYSEESIKTWDRISERYLGISTFVQDLDFNPDGVYSAFMSVPAVYNFVSRILQFEVLDALCTDSANSRAKTDLDRCSLYGSTSAGIKIRSVMRLGRSKPLGEILESLTGQNGLSIEPLLRYFDPLVKWLQEENIRNGEVIGWVEHTHDDKTNVKKRLLSKRSPEALNVPIGKALRELDNIRGLARGRVKRDVHNNKVNYIREQKKKKNQDPLRLELNKLKEYLYNSVDERSTIQKNTELKEKRNGDSKREKSVEFLSRDRSLNGPQLKNVKQKSLQTSKKTMKSESCHQGLDHLMEKSGSQTRIKRLAKRSNYEYGDMSLKKSSGERTQTDTGDEGNNSARYNSRGGNKRRYVKSEFHSPRRTLKDEERVSRNAVWHTNNKKDISRLLHSFGFSVENDDKDKLKEMRKKLKGGVDVSGENGDYDESKYRNGYETNWSNVELKKKGLNQKETLTEEKAGSNFFKFYNGQNVAGSHYKDSSSQYNQAKGGDLKETEERSRLRLSSDSSPDSMKNDADNIRFSLLKDKIFTDPRSSQNLFSKEKLIEVENTESTSKEDSELRSKMSKSAADGGGKDTILPYRNLNLDVPSIQMLLKSVNLNHNQKSSLTDRSNYLNLNLNSDKSRLYEQKLDETGKIDGKENKMPENGGNSVSIKDQTDFKDNGESLANEKSPFVIIVSQLTPEIKSSLVKMKENMQSSLKESRDSKKSDGKLSESLNKINIIPIELRSGISKAHEELERNMEMNQEFEKDQTRFEENSKVNVRGAYGTRKENPLQFITSWNEKKKNLVKRSTNWQKKEPEHEPGLKVIRLAHMKKSDLENLLGRSLEQAALDGEGVKILVQDGLLNDDSDVAPALPSAALSSQYGSQTAESQPPAVSSSRLAPASSSFGSAALSALAPKTAIQGDSKGLTQPREETEEEAKLDGSSTNSMAISKDQKEQDFSLLANPNIRCNTCGGKKKTGSKGWPEDEQYKKVIECESSSRGDEGCCKKMVLTPCPPKYSTSTTSSCPSCPMSYLPSPTPPTSSPTADSFSSPRTEDTSCKKPSECSLVNCQFKITKAKKPHERLTIMIYDRINPPADLPEPYDALAVISEVLQRIQCSSQKPKTQLTEEDPDYPANDNTDQLKTSSKEQISDAGKGKIQEMSGELPVFGNESPEEEDVDDNNQQVNNEDEKSQKATPAIDQLTVFNKQKLKPVLIELRKIDDLVKKRSE